MKNKLNNKICMRNLSSSQNKKSTFKYLLLSFIFILCLVSFASLVNAATLDRASGALSNAGERIGSFFDDYASSEDPGFLDVIIFSTIFIAMSYLGFSQIFKEAKNANIALSAAVGFALSIGLVYGGGFTMKKLLPFASVVLFILLFGGLFAFLRKFVFTGDSFPQKLIAAVIALLISLALIVGSVYMICSDDNCEDNTFLRKVFGSDSIFGNLFTDMRSALSGDGDSDDNDDNDDTNNNEETDSGETGENSNEETEETTPGFWGRVDNATRTPIIRVPFLIGLLIGGGLLLYKGVKKGKEYWKDKNGQKVKKFVDKLTDSEFEVDEGNVTEKFKLLVEEVKKEQVAKLGNEHIVDAISRDIKETIGEEIQFITDKEKEGHHDTIDKLSMLNNHELDILTSSDGIIHSIEKQIALLEGLPNELVKEVNDIANIDTHFKKHGDLLNKLSQYNLTEKNVIDNIVKQTKENLQNFENFSQKCNNILIHLKTIKEKHLAEITRNNIHNKGINYEELLKHIREIRDNTIRMNGLFMQKVALLHTLASSLKSMRDELHEVHAHEIQMTNQFLSHAEEYKNNYQQYDAAIYFASHVLENAQHLYHKELSKESLTNLEDIEEKALKVIKDSMKQVFNSFTENFEKIILSDEYDKLIVAIDNISNILVISKENIEKLNPDYNNFQNHLKQFKQICEELKKGKTIEKETYDKLGLFQIP